MAELPESAAQRIIIDYIDAWQQLLCTSCKRFIEWVWIPYDHFAVAEVLRSATYCPDCKSTDTAGPQPPLTVSAEQMRSRLGLGGVLGPFEAVVRRAFGGHYGGMTLFGDRWFLFGESGRPKTGPNDPFVDRYMILGWGESIPTGDEGRAALTSFPAYDMVLIDQNRKRLPAALEAVAIAVPDINPEDLADVIVNPQRQYALIYLAAVVTDPSMPGVAKQYLCDPHRAFDRYVQDFLDVDRLEPEQIGRQVARLNGSSRKLLEGFIPHAGGRPAGSVKRDRRYLVDGFRQASRKHGRPARQNELIEFLQDTGDTTLTRTTLVRNLRSHGLWPMEKLHAAALRSNNPRTSS